MQRMFDNINELLEKAKYDYKRFEQSGQLQQQYALFDLFNDINCLFDWIIKSEISKNQKDSCINSFNPYKTYKCIPKEIQKHYTNSPFPKLNENQYIIRSVCNLNKHFKVMKKYILKEDTFYPGPDVFPGMTDSPFAHNATIFYCVDENEETYQLDRIIKDAINEWDIFLST
jgi:disulfide oxidoreductase YuzD